ncbi:MAG: hypothetical protein Q9163_000418 [Psora crenata]
MSQLEKSKLEPRPESPTTARALEFDDDTLEPSAPTAKSEPTTKPPPSGPSEEVAPPKPPRPLRPEQRAENTLKEAFPSIDAAVVKAVLHASGGRLEPAFNALLGMSDPDAAEPAPPPQPPRPEHNPVPPTSTEESQLVADERYARQLAEQYNRAHAYGAAPGSQAAQPPFEGPPTKPPRPRANRYEEDRGHSFIDDDLPLIRENIKKGFLETQSTVNKWVANLKKKIDGEDDDDFDQRPAPTVQGYASQNQYDGRRSSEFGRRSADRERYDADPQLLGDDFAGLEMHDAEIQPPRRSSRPLANPDLFKPTPPRPHSSNSNADRRVSFQDGPPEEIDIHYPKSPSPINRPSSGASGKSSKWQPLAAVDPNPVADHDPFSLGDSDDEDGKRKDVKADDSESLKQAAAEAMGDNIGCEKKELEPHGKSGSVGHRDKETENPVVKP